MAISAIYEHEDFRGYLSMRLDRDGRGTRLKLARHIECQPSFVSQVLSGKNELSLEHAHKMNVFFNHSNEEAQYFIHMVLLSKAGSFELQKFWREKMRDLREEQMQVHKVVKRRELHQDDLLYYYSNWLCVSVHMLATIPAMQNPEALRARIGASEKDFAETINFLTRTGLINVEDGAIHVGEDLHLKKTSPYAQAASVLTRLKVLEKIRLSDPRAVNFSANFTISKNAYNGLRKRILDFITELDEHIQSEEPEEFVTLVLDLLEH